MTTLFRIISIVFLLSSALPSLADVDPLRLSIRTNYPTELTTVGQGIQWLLEATDYQLVLRTPAPSDAISLASKPIPPMARLVRIMSIEDAMLALIGTENYLVIDRQHKLISLTSEGE